jgi:2-oxoisovalerate dehydrogenase E1 component
VKKIKTLKTQDTRHTPQDYTLKMPDIQVNTQVKKISEEILLKAFSLMCTAKAMAELYEENKAVTAKYVHATSRGHEAIQLALGLQLLPQDYVFPYYRDDSILLGIGMQPYELMLQLLAKKDDPFSGGRTYYSHPSLKRDNMPKIPHQSSATGMQAIPATGVAMGMQYKELEGLQEDYKEKPVAVCSLGDASVTEGEVAEAFQMAVLKKLPILYFIQDNEWDISANAKEIRAQDANEYAKGFKGLEVRSIDGSDFFESFNTIREVLEIIREERRPFMVHAKVPLLNHHTSGVRKEWYRDDLEEQSLRDPFPRFRKQLQENGIDETTLIKIEEKAVSLVKEDYEKALQAEDPSPEDLFTHDFAPTPITEEKGIRTPEGKEPTVMVDSALFAIQELMAKHKECLLYGQDVGGRLGGVFREAATLAQKFGDARVFNTPIQEAFIIGSTVGMSAVGLKPIVEVQFADYIWPGLNQLFTEVSRSCYLSNGKWPVSCIIRVPIGAYGSGGPYHSSSVESVLANIRGIKVAYPSTGADLKGLMKSAYYDPNPVVMLEHKGLYWSKIKGTEEARTIEPDEDYVIPFGKARMVLEAEAGTDKPSLSVITYGMGVYWAKNAAKNFMGQIEIVDLRTINPIDEDTIFKSVNKHSRCLVLTEEPVNNSFAQALAGRIQKACFKNLDAPVDTLGAENLPAIPLNSTLEATMLPNTNKVAEAMKRLLEF